MGFTLRRRFAPWPLAWIGATVLAQAPAEPDVVRVFHPHGPALSYDVSTVKPSDPDQPYAGTTLRRYIAGAYGVPIPWGVPGVEYPGAQILGGPAWIDKDKYDIKGQAPDEVRASMEKLSADEGRAQTETMQQALLAERFHLKVHFETREMQIFELVAAKGGLKIKPVDPPPTGGNAKPFKPGDPMPPGTMGLSVRLNGASTLEARATNIDLLCRALRGQSPDIAGRPIVDRTGFQGNFDVKDFRFAGVAPPQHGTDNNGDQDTPPSVFAALEEDLGLKLVPAKGQVDVVVIDSIDRPTEN